MTASDSPRNRAGGFDQSDYSVADRVLEALPDADADATSLCFGIIRAADRLQQDFEVSVQRPQGMTWAGFRTMFALATIGPLRPLELARLNSVSQASITSIIKTLGRAGAVVTEPSVDDARSVTVSLTPAGRERFEFLFRRNNARETQWAAALSTSERATLIRLLGKLQDLDLPPIERPRVERAV